MYLIDHLESLFAVYMVSGLWQIRKLFFKKLQTLCFLVSSRPRNPASVERMCYWGEAADVRSLVNVPSSELTSTHCLNNIRYKHMDFFDIFIKS